MDRYLGGKSHESEFVEETFKHSKKLSQRKHSGDVPFQKLGQNVTVSAPRLKSFSRFKSHKSKDSDIRKILGAIRGNNPSKERTSHSGLKSKRNTASSSDDSFPNSPSQHSEHRSYHKTKKRRKGNEDNLQKKVEKQEHRKNDGKAPRGEEDKYHRRFVKDDVNKRCEESHQRGDYFYGMVENENRRVSRKLTFSSSESEGEGSSMLNNGSLSPGFRSRVPDNLPGNEEVERSPAEIVMIAENKRETTSPVLSKTKRPFNSDQDVLAEYMNFAAEITDELTIERQKLFHGSSYLEMVSQNLLGVFIGRSGKEKDLAEKETDGKLKALTEKGRDFVTPTTSGTDVVDPNEPHIQNDEISTENVKRTIESVETPMRPRETVRFSRVQKEVHDKARSISASNENFPTDTFSQCKLPKNPVDQLFKIGEINKGSQLHLQNPVFLSPCDESIPSALLENGLTYLQTLSPKVDRGGNRGRKVTTKPPDYVFHKDRDGPLLPPKRPPGDSSFPPHPVFPQNDDVPLSQREGNVEYSQGHRRHNRAEMTGKLSRRTCTATSTRPINYDILDSPLVVPEVESSGKPQTRLADEFTDSTIWERDFGLGDQHVYPQERLRGDVSLDINPTGSIRFREVTNNVESFQKESFLNSFGLLNTNKTVVPIKEEWVVSPKYYKRRMF